MKNVNLTTATTATTAALYLVGCASSNAEQVAQKPNILWIVTDDHRPDALECYNQATRGTSESELGYVFSPELNKLANEGTLFTNSYCNSPVSGSSRASMISGLYTFHRGIYGFDAHNVHLDFMTPTTPEYIAQMGYNTLGIGKLGVRIQTKDESGKLQNYNMFQQFFHIKDYNAAGLADWINEGAEDQHGKGSRYRFTHPDGSQTSYFYARDNGKLTAEDIAARDKFESEHDVLRRYNAGSVNMRKTIIGGVSPQPSNQTYDGYITQEFQKYVANQDRSYTNMLGREMEGPASSQPQFLYMGYHFPHTAVLPSASFRDRFKDKTYNLPEFDQEEFDRMPNSMKNWCSNAHVATMKDKDKQQFIRDYYAFCAMGDSLLGATVTSFKDYCKSNKQDYVIVVVVGDHGWHLGEQGVCAKGQGFKGSTHTAMIVVGSDKKRYPAKNVVSDFVEFVDVLPTLVAAAGHDLKSEEFAHLDGYDLAEVISGEKAPRDYVISELGSNVHMRTKDFFFTMQNRSMPKGEINKEAVDKEYARMMSVKDLSTINCALYDLRVDPKERRNVALEPEYSELAEWFHQKLGTIALGNGRIECDWKKGIYTRSTFGLGSDNKKFDAPQSIIPTVNN